MINLLYANFNGVKSNHYGRQHGLISPKENEQPEAHLGPEAEEVQGHISRSSVHFIITGCNNESEPPGNQYPLTDEFECPFPPYQAEFDTNEIGQFDCDTDEKWSPAQQSTSGSSDTPLIDLSWSRTRYEELRFRGNIVAERTFLSRSIELSKSAKQIFLPSGFGYDVLSKAVKLSQEALFERAKQSWPSLHRRNFAQGPHEALLGRKELENLLYDADAPLEIETSDYSMIRQFLMEVVPLRNAVCHFGAYRYSEAETYDNLLRKAHMLTVTLYDERRALMVRNLREEVHKKAEETVAELLALSSLAVLPFFNRDAWSVYHNDLLGSIWRYERITGEPLSKELCHVVFC
ncbi:hypothetical protein JX266_009073 [Neoarthrinium moseri]|nr:hypothetical protein JX266_009073 [Neoarthrinium moseri]